MINFFFAGVLGVVIQDVLSVELRSFDVDRISAVVNFSMY